MFRRAGGDARHQTSLAGCRAFGHQPLGRRWPRGVYVLLRGNVRIPADHCSDRAVVAFVVAAREKTGGLGRGGSTTPCGTVAWSGRILRPFAVWNGRWSRYTQGGSCPDKQLSGQEMVADSWNGE